MPPTVDQIPTNALKSIEAAALLLNPNERAELAERLWASVEGAEEASGSGWEAEIMHRMQEVDSGTVESRPWDEIISELWAKHQG